MSSKRGDRCRVADPSRWTPPAQASCRSGRKAPSAETIRDATVALFADFDNRQRVGSLAAKRRPAKTMPVIDFGAYTQDGDAAARRRVAAALREACTDTGFFYLVEHGISAAELDLAHDWGHVFFELSRDEKARCNFMPVGGSNAEANPDKEADQKETYSPQRPLQQRASREPRVAHRRPPDVARAWPDAGLPRLPSRRASTGRIHMAQHLCRAQRQSLDLAEDFLDEAHRYPSGSVTYNYYPALDPATVQALGRRRPIPTMAASSLQHRRKQASGLGDHATTTSDLDRPAPPMRGAFVVNIAELFARWTNGVRCLELHRASNFRTGSRARVSLPLFFNPSYWTQIECLPSCAGPGNPPKYEPVEAGPYVRALIDQSRRIGRPGLMKSTGEARLKPM